VLNGLYVMGEIRLLAGGKQAVRVYSVDTIKKGCLWVSMVHSGGSVNHFLNQG